MNNNLKKLKIISIIVLVLVAFLFAIDFAIPKMSVAREKAFRVEATKFVDASFNAIKKYQNNELEIENDNDSCVKGSVYCFTVNKLIEKNIYDGNGEYYKGKIIIDNIDTNNPVIDLYFRKNDEFRIINGFHRSYTDFGNLSYTSWEDEYEICNCD